MSIAVMFAVVLRDPVGNMADFYTFWDSAQWLRMGVDPYAGHALRPGAGYNLNPPFMLLLFLPFSFFPLLTAFVLWTIVNLVGYAVSAWAIARETNPAAVVEIVAAILISQATFSGLQLGQPVGFLMTAVTAAWIADRRGSLYLAGLLLGVAMAAKVFLGLFVVYALWRRSARLLGGILSGLAATIAIGLIPAGMAGYQSWVSVLGQVTWAAHLANASIFGFLTRLLTVPPKGLEVTPLTILPGAVRPLWYLLVTATAFLAVWRGARMRNPNRAWLLTLSASLLWSPLGWSYYIPLVAGPVAALTFDGSRTERILIACGYACFLVPYTLLVLRPLGRFGTATFGSVYLWGTVLWFVAALTTIQARRRETIIWS